MNRMIAILAAAVVLTAASGVWADGMIVPVRDDMRVRGAWAVKYHHVRMTVRDQVAMVAIDQEFINTSRGMIEVEYLFPVPPGAAIDAMTLMVNGKEFAAQLLPADEARRIYEEIVRRKKDPALLEYAGFGLIKTRAFPLEAGKPARVLVNYKYTCRKDHDAVEVWYPLNTEKYSALPIEDVEVVVDIKSKADVLAPYSPTHEITVEPKGPGHVVVTYRQKDTLPHTDFQVFYKESEKDVGAILLTHQGETDKDGYFQVLVSPNPRLAASKVVPKDVVIAFDHSGSMAGEKLAQAKEALRFILNTLNEGDRFDVVAYHDLVDTFFEELVPADRERIKQALDRLDRIEPGGGTNIHEALLTALSRCQGRLAGKARPTYVLFLTDGIPTVGKTGEGEILADAKKANDCGARLFAFGVGYDVNVRLLDRLVEDHGGRSAYVKPNEPIEVKVSSLYSKIKNPVMTDVKLKIQGVRTYDMYPRELGDLFDGDQIVVVGRYDPGEFGRGGREGRTTQLIITGTYDGKERGFEYPVTICPPGRRGHEFVEKLWAIRRVGYLLDEVQLRGESKEVIDEIIRLSKTYGIMTPYTAFLADERTELASRDDVRRRLGSNLEELRSQVTGAAGQYNADNRGRYKYADAPAPTAAPGTDGQVTVLGHGSQESYEGDRAETVGGLRQVGNQAVFQRGRLWVASNASDVDVKRDAARIQTIERFSEAYFELVRQNSVADNQVLASQQPGEELLISLRGQTYLIK